MGAESIVVALFKKEQDAMGFEHQLHAMDEKRQVKLGSVILMRKKQDGSFEYLKKEHNNVGGPTLVGMAIGVIATMFMGPIVWVAGTIAGTAIGAGVGYSETKLDKDAIEKVKMGIEPGDIAVIANCEEHSSTVMDETMQNYTGAKLFRTTA